MKSIWKKDVKQGDPLSALLIILAIDDMIEELHSKFNGINVNNTNCKITSLTYGDDLLPFASRISEAQNMLNHISESLFQKGMRLNAIKCLRFTVKKMPHKRKLIVLENTKYHINNEEITIVKVDGNLKYLGSWYNC